MKITYLGVELHRAEQIDLPNILRWRNQAQVRQFMQHQSIISAEHHQDWFDHLHKQTNFYFILKKDGALGGLLQLSEIDYYRRRAEAGILIGEAFFRGSYLPWLGSYTLLRFAFDLLHLEQLNATVCEQNITAKEYNQSFGFRKINAHDNGFCTYTLTRVAWRAATQPYKQLLKLLNAQKMSIDFCTKKSEDRGARQLIRQRRSSIMPISLDPTAYAGAERGLGSWSTSSTASKEKDAHKAAARP